tara:strand:- start:164 stop:340 length:177 start_codon:yes stop_codon:yes gene_type:complete
MKLTEAIKILENHNKWRRDNTGELTMANPTLLGKAIDAVLIAAKFANTVKDEVVNEHS